MNTDFVARNIVLAIALLFASTSWAKSPFAEGSKLIITNNTLEFIKLIIPMQQGLEEVKTFTIYPTSEASKLHEVGQILEKPELSFDAIKFYDIGIGSLMSTAQVVGPTKGSIAFNIAYYPSSHELTLQASSQREIKEVININVPIEIELILDPGKDLVWRVHQPITLEEQGRITTGRVVPELSKQSEAEKLLEYKRK